MYPRIIKDTRTKVSAKAVMTAIKPPWFVFDIIARGALTPRVAAGEDAEVGADIVGDNEEGPQMSPQRKITDKRRLNRGVDYKIDKGSVMVNREATQEKAKAK